MFSKKMIIANDYSYANLMYVGQIGFPSKPFQGQTYNQLVEEVNQALFVKEYDDAITKAKTAAIQYGLAGLLLYVNAMTDYLKEQQKQGELVEVPVSNMLALLDFARAMLNNKDAKALKSISLMGINANTYETAAYWDEKKEELYKLAPEKSQRNQIEFEAAATTERLIQRCSEEHFSQTSNPGR